MDLLYWLEGLRTPFGNVFFSFVTHFGEEMLFILIGLIFFWCLDKKEGYYLLSIGLFGTVINQFLKLACRIPRPWVRDPDFTIVESARAQATGYSFPSGHTQAAVGVYAGIAHWHKNTALRIGCIALCVLVPFSRMYLGVHTPADVGVSLAVALALVFALYPVVRRASGSRRGMRILFSAMTAVAVGLVLYANCWPFPAAMDAANLASGVKNGWKMLGCIAGMWVVYELDERYIHFDTKAVWWAQILKLALGLVPLLAVMVGLKAPLDALFGSHMAAYAVRYFLVVLTAGALWPLTFRFFGSLGRRKSR